MKRIIIFLALICLAGGFAYFKMNDRLHSCETELFVPIPNYLKDSTGRVMMTRAYVAPAHTKLTPSDNAIKLAIDDYQLEDLFELKEGELKNMVTSSLEVIQLEEPDSKLIKTFAKSQERAQQLNYAIVNSYLTMRKEGLGKRRLESLRVFEMKKQMQVDKVHDHEARLDALSKKLEMSYRFYPSKGEVRASYELAGELTEEGHHTLLYVEKTRFEKVSEDYEREVAILDAIETAMQSQLERENSSTANYKLNETGWSPEVETMMAARKAGK